MPKITNITSDEREQAIYTIGKLGEEVTDERIEYYVQLRRNTVKHQEEKASKEAVNQISEQTKEWRSNTKKEGNEDVVKKAIRLAKIAFWLGVILVILPFFITGFGFGWFWYLIIIGVAFFSFLLLEVTGKDKGDYSYVKTVFIGFCVLGCFMFLWGPLNPNYERSSGSWSSSSGSGPDMRQLVERASRETGYGKHEIYINNIVFVHDNPPTYEFDIHGPYGLTHKGRCSLSSQGNVRGFSVTE